MSKIKANKYKTVIFDCDGVILHSNKIKTQAFYNVALAYGEKPANLLVSYHVKNGGISRYKKFEYLFKELLGKKIFKKEMAVALEKFAIYVKKELMNCEISDGLHDLREKHNTTRWLVVSGGSQSELREIFVARGLSKLFDGSIYGSPDTKDQILSREIQNKNITFPALYIGDSKYDYRAAIRANIDFIFLTKWTEVTRWNEWTNTNKIEFTSDISSLLARDYLSI